MTREELYKAMEHEKIILYDEFLAHLERTPLPELVTRWTGVSALEKEYKPCKNRPDWLAMFLWNSTALTVGEDELVRRETERKREGVRKAEAERKRKEEEEERILTGKKLSFWHLCSERDRRQLVMNLLPKCDEFYQEYVRQHYLGNLRTMNDRMVLLWFWNALPPFSIFEEEQPEHPAIAA